jgi:RNA polymerase sigma-70 factor, ECF subfamily
MRIGLGKRNGCDPTSLFVCARERPETFGEVFREHHTAVLRFLARRTFDPEVATDLMAETFAHMLANLASFDGRSDEQGCVWMWTIARNLLNDWYRRAHVEKRYMERVGVEPRPLDSDEYERIEELADLRALREVVRENIFRLKPVDRQVVRLRVVDERSCPEIAKMLGLTTPAVKIRVSNTLRELAVVLNEELEDATERAWHTSTSSGETLLT